MKEKSWLHTEGTNCLLIPEQGSGPRRVGHRILKHEQVSGMETTGLDQSESSGEAGTGG